MLLVLLKEKGRKALLFVDDSPSTLNANRPRGEHSDQWSKVLQLPVETSCETQALKRGRPTTSRDSPVFMEKRSIGFSMQGASVAAHLSGSSV